VSRGDTSNVLLVLVGSALLKLTMTGTYLRYVKPSANPWLLAAGTVMILLAVASIIRDLRGDATGHTHRARGAWLLVLPVLTIFLVAPPALGADSVLRAGTAVPPNTALPPLPRRGVVPLTMSDLITRTVWDGTHSLDGRTVTVTGFVVHHDGADYVARLVITCCAADATPMKVALTGHLASALPDNQWVAVTGRVRPGSAVAADAYTPTFAVTSLHTVDQPADPYEH
jgi:uncharacterized repeat protein (TIGR03943 family)